MNNHFEMTNPFYLAPVSKKSFASLIFAAMYGEPPRRGYEEAKILKEDVYLDRDD